MIHPLTALTYRGQAGTFKGLQQVVLNGDNQRGAVASG